MDVDVAVVGAGVLGLSAGAALARAGRTVVVLEANAGIGREITSRNSEVVHAGIYYPADSLKARLCVAGQAALYARCESQRIGHRRCGKLIVACDDQQIATLEQLLSRGAANGAADLEIIDAAAIARMEPEVRGRAALWSPNTGIVDGQALCLSYAAEMESLGASLALRTRVVGIEPAAGGYRIRALGDDAEQSEIACAAVVNAAGLDASAIAEMAGFDLDACRYRIHPCKGDYFAVAPGAPLHVSRLIYPVPQAAGLGVHITLDLAGRIRLGPDAEYMDRRRYDIDPHKAVQYANAVGSFVPGLRPDWLSPDYAGIRPRLAAPGEMYRDFAIREESDRGRPGFVNAIGIESPGLTAAEAIADHIVGLLAGL